MTRPISEMTRSELVDEVVRLQQRNADLAAHVEAGKRITKVGEYAEWCRESPETSLARLKAQWFTETAKSLREAEARAHLEPDEDMPLDEVDLIDMWDTSQVSDWMNEQADELRRQDEGGEE